MHHIALAVLLTCFIGCKSDKAAEGEKPPIAETSAKDDASPPVVASKTANLLPPELEGVTIGMSVDEFRAARKATSLRVRWAYYVSEENKMTGNETDEEWMTKLDAQDAQRRKVEAADWPGEEGLYYIEETFEKSPIQKADYTFKDGVLRVAIVYYPSPELAKEATRVLLGKEYTAANRWTGSASGGGPLKGWAFKDRYVLRADSPAVKAGVTPDAGASADKPESE